MILVNGAVADSVAVTDRGLAYGDGVFRTLLIKQGKPRCWQRHYRKLAHDCATLAIPCPAETVLREELERAAGSEAECVAKLIVTRGSGVRGYAQPERLFPTRIVMTQPMPRYPVEFMERGVTVRLCSTRLAFQPRLAGIKHLNRLENVLARAEWSDAQTAEGLMLDPEGNAICGTMTNLFIVEKDALTTPELSRCGVAGITRERLLEAAVRHGVECRVEQLPLERVCSAQEVLLVNSVIGVWQVKKLSDRAWQPGRSASRVRQWLDEQED